MKKKDPLIQIENKFATEALYKMTLIEQKIFYALVSRLNPHEEEEFKKVGLTVSEIAEAIGEDLKNHQNLYSRISNIRSSLVKKTFKFPIKVEKKGRIAEGEITFFQSIIPRSNEHGEATMYFQFVERLKPFLLQLNEYVKMNQLCIAKLKSVYSIRLYTTLKAIRAKRQKHEKVSRETWKVKELKELIGASKKYERFYNFKKRAIEPAFKEINAKTDITILDIQYIIEGRTIKEITFIFRDQTDPTTIEESSTGDIPF